MKSHTQKVGLVGAGLLVAFYALCLVWGVLISDPTLSTLHFNLLQITYPGFAFSAVGLIVGLVETIIYGYLFGVLFAWLCKITCVHE